MKGTKRFLTFIIIFAMVLSLGGAALACFDKTPGVLAISEETKNVSEEQADADNEPAAGTELNTVSNDNESASEPSSKPADSSSASGEEADKPASDTKDDGSTSAIDKQQSSDTGNDKSEIGSEVQAEKNEDEREYSLEKTIKTSDGKYYKVIASYDRNTGIPENAILKVDEVSPDDKEYEKLNSKSEKALEKFEKSQEKKDSNSKSDENDSFTLSLCSSIILDIKITSALGKEYQPKKGTTVKVSVISMPAEEDKEEYAEAYEEYINGVEDEDNKEASKSENTENDSSIDAETLSEYANQDKPVVHIKDNGKTEVLESETRVTEEGLELSFETASFSKFYFYLTGESNDYFDIHTFIKRAESTREQSGSVGNYSTKTISKDEYIGKWISLDEVKRVLGYGNRYSVNYAQNTDDSHASSSGNKFYAIGIMYDYANFLKELGITSSGFVNTGLYRFNLNLYLIDNSLPVEFYQNGTKIGDQQNYVDSYSGTSSIDVNSFDICNSYYSYLKGLTSSTGNRGYAYLSSSVSGNAVSSLSYEVYNTELYNNGTAWQNGSGIARYPDWAEHTGVRIGYSSFGPYTYRPAYQWKYNNGTTDVNVADTPLIINVVPAVARVTNEYDGSGNPINWKNFGCLVRDPANDVYGQGAFDYASTLTGNVIIETLYDTHETYTIKSGVTFDKNANITIRTTTDTTINPTGSGNFTSTISRGYDGESLITLNKSSASLTVTDINFDGCSASFKCISTGNGGGGIIHCENGSGLTMERVKIKDSTSTRNGGGVYTSDKAGTVTLTNVEFDNCSAAAEEGYTGKECNGGGAFFRGLASVTGVTASNCHADGSEAKGGGLYFLKANSTVGSGTSFSGCTAVYGAGVYFYDTGCKIEGTSDSKVTFSGCTAAKRGGGLYAAKSIASLKYATFTDCKATNESGGGIYLEGGLSDPETSPASNLELYGCTATKSNGGGMYLKGNVTLKDVIIDGSGIQRSERNYINNAVNGGGVCQDTGNLVLTGSTLIKECKATTNGGGVYVKKATMHMKGLVDDENYGVIYCHADKKGGGVALDDSSGLVMESGCISYNEALEWGGGGIRIEKYSSAEIKGGKITYNEARNRECYGGGINIKNGSVEVSGGEISHNSVTSNSSSTDVAGGGAAIHVSGDGTSGNPLDEGNLVITGGIFSDNTVKATHNHPVYGGAIDIRGDRATATISGGTFSNNTVETTAAATTTNPTVGAYGGAVAAYKGGHLTVTGGSFSANQAVGVADTNGKYNNYGAGIYVSTGSDMKISGGPEFDDSNTVYLPEYASDDPDKKKKNGPNYTYTSDVRQDIYLEDAPNTLEVIADMAADKEGGIWVWVANSDHYESEKSFAKCSSTDVPKNLNIFRNARDDDITKNFTDSYLYGTDEGQTKGFVYWNGPEGKRKVILRKTTMASYAPKSGVQLKLYKIGDYAKDPSHPIANFTSQSSGIWWIGELAYGDYEVIENGVNNKAFYFRVNKKGISPKEMKLANYITPENTWTVTIDNETVEHRINDVIQFTLRKDDKTIRTAEHGSSFEITTDPAGAASFNNNNNGVKLIQNGDIVFTIRIKDTVDGLLTESEIDSIAYITITVMDEDGEATGDHVEIHHTESGEGSVTYYLEAFYDNDYPVPDQQYETAVTQAEGTGGFTVGEPVEQVTDITVEPNESRMMIPVTFTKNGVYTVTMTGKTGQGADSMNLSREITIDTFSDSE